MQRTSFEGGWEDSPYRPYIEKKILLVLNLIQCIFLKFIPQEDPSAYPEEARYGFQDEH
jgi:hypothetical protein